MIPRNEIAEFSGWPEGAVRRWIRKKLLTPIDTDLQGNDLFDPNDILCCMSGR